ncbi:hypothetical protein KU40_05340 [Clostridium botulinum]|nr:hypothetical protein KU40_05340 [Clostridium botulinum]
MGYRPVSTGILTGCHESGDTPLLGGQFDLGGPLLKSNGGAPNLPQNRLTIFVTFKDIIDHARYIHTAVRAANTA